MPVYDEKPMRWYSASLFLVIVFLLLTSPYQIGNRELYWQEGDYAAMAQEPDLFIPLAHGELLPSTFPLFPWLAGQLNGFGVPMELTLRLISIGSLAAIAFLVWEAGRRAINIQAAAVGTALLISSPIVVEKAIDGFPHFMALLFIFSGWLAWFTWGVARGKWTLAWLVSSICCGLGFYTTGWEAIIFFFFPFLFMRRPMTVWPKIKRSSFWAGIVIIFAFIFTWGIPRWLAGTDIPFRTPPTADIFSGYWKHFLTFPFEISLRFFPWTLIAWAPFCVAFHPLDKNPIFSRFLRTIFISLFFLLWFSPFTRSRDLIILAPPLAVMTGINYWLLIRRYGRKIHQLIKIFRYPLIVAGIATVIFYSVPVEWWQGIITLPRLTFVNTHHYQGLTQGALAAAIGVYLLFGTRTKLKLWIHLLMILLGTVLLFWAVVHPYKAQKTPKRDFGNSVRQALGKAYSPSLIIYKDKVIVGLFSECHYLDCKVEMRALDDLPTDKKQVFIISTEVPTSVDRSWKKLCTQKYKQRNVYLWQGSRIENDKKKKK